MTEIDPGVGGELEGAGDGRIGHKNKSPWETGQGGQVDGECGAFSRDRVSPFILTKERVCGSVSCLADDSAWKGEVVLCWLLLCLHLTDGKRQERLRLGEVLTHKQSPEHGLRDEKDKQMWLWWAPSWWMPLGRGGMSPSYDSISLEIGFWVAWRDKAGVAQAEGHLRALPETCS